MIPSTLTGKKLQAWRIKKGWSRSYVATRVGKSYGWMWGLEISTEFVPLDAALLFAAVDRDIEPLS